MTAIIAARPARARRSPRARHGASLLTLLAWAVGLMFFAPAAWMVLTSLHTGNLQASRENVSLIVGRDTRQAGDRDRSQVSERLLLYTPSSDSVG